MSLLYPKNNYKFIETAGEEKAKMKIVQDNRKMIKDINECIIQLKTDVDIVKKDLKEILELVRKKEERDMNKWLTWG
jgi:hypothetical protein